VLLVDALGLVLLVDEALRADAGVMTLPWPLARVTRSAPPI
jgi:hypothetical protein